MKPLTHKEEVEIRGYCAKANPHYIGKVVLAAHDYWKARAMESAQQAAEADAQNDILKGQLDAADSQIAELRNRVAIEGDK